jgi:hypothetical protein
MTNDEKANAVALSLQTVMHGLHQFFDALVGKGQHNIVLVVGAGDVEQYISNRDRDVGAETLRSLLARWNAGVPDRLPGEVEPGDLAPARHLLAELERCLNEDARGLPHLDKRLTTQMARDNLLAYVGEQIAKANRGSAASC